jgi:hypothetical protein
LYDGFWACTVIPTASSAKSSQAEEFVNETLKLSYLKFSAFAAQTVPHPTTD